MAYVNDALYVCGGVTDGGAATAQCDKLNLDTKQWEDMPDMLVLVNALTVIKEKT